MDKLLIRNRYSNDIPAVEIIIRRYYRKCLKQHMYWVTVKYGRFTAINRGFCRVCATDRCAKDILRKLDRKY